MSLKRILAGAAVVIASLVSAGITQPAFAAAQPAAGSLDPTFGVGGKVLTNLGTGANGQQIQAAPSDAVLQSNGDIVVSGNFGLVPTCRTARWTPASAPAAWSGPAFP